MNQEALILQKKVEEKRAVLGIPQKQEQTTENQSSLSIEDQKRRDAYVCKEHGYLEPIPLECSDFVLFKPCSVCAKASEEAEAKREVEREQRLKRERIESRMAGLGIGSRFRDATFGDYQPQNAEAKKIRDLCEKYAATFPERLKHGEGMIFVGKCGTGKNMLAACICQDVIRQDYVAVHTTVFKLVRRIKDTWRKESEETEAQAIRFFAGPDLLVIDEVGVQYGSDTERLFLTEVVNERYEQMKPTILISNLTLDGLEGVLGERVIDRFYEGRSAVLKFIWDSYRRQRNN